MSQNVFQRYETKYMLNQSQYSALAEAMRGHTVLDPYGTYTISNLYYDTERYDLIRASLDKPAYKEKLRMRCYGTADENTTVFIELKKKYKGIVYKRRDALPYCEARHFLETGAPAGSQVLREIASFLSTYRVRAQVFLSYDRLALSGAQDPDLRITFDQHVRFRQSHLSLAAGTWGTEILPPGKTLLEVKTPGALPLWLTRALSEARVFPSSYSKYGVCYAEYIYPQIHNDRMVSQGA